MDEEGGRRGSCLAYRPSPTAYPRFLGRNHRQRSSLVFQVQPMVPVVVRDLAALDEDLHDVRAEVERIAGGNEEVREFALRDRADLLLRAEDLGRPDG